MDGSRREIVSIWDGGFDSRPECTKLALAVNRGSAKPPVAEGSRDESNVEILYRFPLFPGIDTTFRYMVVINPDLDPNNDFASVFSLRLMTVF